MSIAQIFDQTTPFVSGYSMRSRYITDSLTRLGVKVRAFSSPIFSYKAKQETIGNVPYVRSEVPLWNIVRRVPVFKEYCIIEAIKNTLESSWNDDIQLLDAHSSLLNGLAAVEVAKKHKIPFMYEIRALWEDAAVDQGKTREGSLRYNLTRKIETDVAHKADRVTVICEGLRRDIIGRGFSEDKITIIPNGVDTDIFKPQPMDKNLKKQHGFNDCLVIGFIGTFFHFEGLELLVRAARQILAERKDVKFFLVGGGEREAELKKLANELGLTQHIVFSGRVKHDDIQKYYSIMDVLVYPRISKRITELVTPLKPLEAMAMEKFVLASDVGGLRELVTSGVTGMLFKAGDIDDLADKCLWAINNIGETQGMSRAARAYVVRERNWLKICERYLTIFRELGVH